MEEDKQGKRGMRDRKVLYVIVGAVAILATVAVVVWRVRAAGLSREGVRSAVVERGTLLVTVSASGSVESPNRVDLAFETRSQIAEVLVEVEDVVATGDVLARLDEGLLALQVAQARAALTSARAQLRQAEDGPRPEEIAAAEANVEAAEAQVTAAVAARDQVLSGATSAQIAAAEADLAAALAQQRSAEDLHDRTMKCFTFTWFDGSEKTFCPALGVIEEQARYSMEAANEGLEAARAVYDEVVAGADADQVRSAEAAVMLAAAQRDVAQVQLDLLLAGATEEQIAALRTQEEQAEAALEQAELALENGTLRAAFDGVVAVVNATAGEMATPGLPAISLVDPSAYRVLVRVDEIDVARLSEGQRAKVTLEALPDVQFSGTVTRIAPVASFDAEVVYYDVIIELDPTDAPIRVDMTANVTIVVESREDVLTIPTWVVRVDRNTGQTYVERPAGRTTERVDVVLGVRYEGAVEVLEGLSAGEEVVWVPSEFNGFAE